MTKHNAHTGEGEGPAEEKTGLGEEAVPGPETPASEASAGENPAGEAPQDGNTAEERAAGDGAAAELPPGDRIAALEAQTADLKDQYLRKAADFENFRKRMIREKQDAIDFANQSLLLDLIPIIDDFERALKSGEALAGGGNAAEAPADTAESAAPAGPE
ncbi:MAG: nucleotide exchange factor GrpE, partial [Treponema sp.]|nr:nucleotide exchange factor GrpE [Treponema sp.]